MMKTISRLAATALLLATATAFAQEPAQNISQSRHGNLAAAQSFTRKAYDAMTAAQMANEYDLGGHAANAKTLLDQAADEMKKAAMAANHH
jgi:hypothetical protein